MNAGAGRKGLLREIESDEEQDHVEIFHMYPCSSSVFLWIGCSSISPLALGDISAYTCGYLRVCLEISPLLLLILTRLSEKWDCILGRYGGNPYLC